MAVGKTIRDVKVMGCLLFGQSILLLAVHPIDILTHAHKSTWTTALPAALLLTEVTAATPVSIDKIDNSWHRNP